MPLLCTSLLALLLLSLSLSLSCDDQKPLSEVVDDHKHIIATLLNFTSENITALLQNHSCREPKHPPPSCPSNTDLVNVVHDLNCELQKTGLSEVVRLAKRVQDSIPCQCREKPKTPSGKRKKKETMQKRNGQRKIRRRKLCRAKVILSHMTQCFQMLNTLLAS